MRQVLTSSSSESSQHAAACGRAWPSFSSSHGSPGGTRSAYGAARCTRSATVCTRKRGEQVMAAEDRTTGAGAAPHRGSLSRPQRDGSTLNVGQQDQLSSATITPTMTTTPHSADPTASSAAKRAGRLRSGPGWKRSLVVLWFLLAERRWFTYPEGFAPDLAGPERRKSGTGEAGTALFAAWVCQVRSGGWNPGRLGGGAGGERKKKRAFRQRVVLRLFGLELG